jgi:hypothetical protein
VAQSQGWVGDKTKAFNNVAPIVRNLLVVNKSWLGCYLLVPRGTHRIAQSSRELHTATDVPRGTLSTLTNNRPRHRKTMQQHSSLQLDHNSSKLLLVTTVLL